MMNLLKRILKVWKYGYKKHSSIKNVKPIKGLSENSYNYLVSYCKRKIEKCKDNPSLLLVYNEHRNFLELLERVGRDFIEKEK